MIIAVLTQNIIFHFSKEKPNRFRSVDFVQTGRNTEYRIISVDIVLDLTVMKIKMLLYLSVVSISSLWQLHYIEISDTESFLVSYGNKCLKQVINMYLYSCISLCQVRLILSFSPCPLSSEM